MCSARVHWWDTRSPHFMCVISTVASIWWDSCESYHSVMATDRRFRWKSGKFHSLPERWFKCIRNMILCYFIAFYKTFHVYYKPGFAQIFQKTNIPDQNPGWFSYFSTLFHVQSAYKFIRVGYFPTRSSKSIIKKLKYCLQNKRSMKHTRIILNWGTHFNFHFKIFNCCLNENEDREKILKRKKATKGKLHCIQLLLPRVLENL